MHRLLSRVHEKEAACAVCIFYFPGLKAALAEESRLLISRSPSDGDFSSHHVRGSVAVYTAGGLYIREHAPGHMEILQNFLIPALFVNIKEHGPGRVGVVRHMDAALCQIPDQPGVHGSEEKLPPLCPFPGAFHMIQYPFDLAPGEICVGNKAGPLPDFFLPSLRLQPLNPVRRPAALPDNGIVHRLSRVLVPDNGRLPLVCNADGRNVAVVGADLSHSLHSNRQLRGPDFHRVMLHPARLGINLGKLLLRHAAYISLFVKQNTAGAGCPLVQCNHVFSHILSS